MKIPLSWERDMNRLKRLKVLLAVGLVGLIVSGARADDVLLKTDSALRRELKAAPDPLVMRVKRAIAEQIDENNYDHSFGAHWESVIARDGRPVVPRRATRTDPASLEMDTNINDDEMSNVYLIMRLDRTFGIEIPDEEAEWIFLKDPTVGRLVACVRKHLRAKRGDK